MTCPGWIISVSVSVILSLILVLVKLLPLLLCRWAMAIIYLLLLVRGIKCRRLHIRCRTRSK